MPPYLDDDLSSEVFNAIVSTGLFMERRGLMANIPPGYWGIFPFGNGPAAQAFIDLGRLNNDGPLADGSVPLRKWLRNAYDLARVTAEGPVFQRAIDALDRRLRSELGGGAADVFGALAAWKEGEIGSVLRRLPVRSSGHEAPAADALALVKAAAGGQWLDQLLVAALAQRLGDVDMVRVAEARGLVAAFVPQRATPPIVLQRILNQKKASQDIGVWRAKLFKAEVAVARVERNIDDMWKAVGTAFLVGPDLVMTNYHVVAGLVPGASAPVTGELRFRFDFKRTTDGARLLDGILVNPADDWHVISAPPSAVDEMVNPGDLRPGDGELDFAVIRLATSVGNQAVGATDGAAPGTLRRWLRLAKDPALTLLAEHENVFILQHPESAALQIAAGTFLHVAGNRVRYDTNTEYGSSGSPCLDARLDVVALHHGGDPSYAELHRPTYNQGIPMHLIVARCAAEGVTFPPPPEP
jgi:hypothetical protein